jgi:Zn-dependent protease
MWGDERRTEYRVTYFPQEVYIEPPQEQGFLKFSDEEKKNLLMAIGALTLAFTLFWRGLNIPFYLIAILSFCAVITGFLLHEIGHKYMAQKYGCWAEFRAWPQWLLLAVISGFFGFLLAAPGAVYHKGYLTQEQTGKVSAAGPVVNITMASFLLPIVFFFPDIIYEIWILLYMICLLNVIIGGFNLIPVFGLDGTKIIKWNKGIYIGLFAILAFYGVLLLFPGLIFGLF